MRAAGRPRADVEVSEFPFLFGGTFIEGRGVKRNVSALEHFPSFSEGLSLRVLVPSQPKQATEFPFLFGGTFIEGSPKMQSTSTASLFPFLFGGTFIEGSRGGVTPSR